jgi:hypothetical protein
VRGRSSARVAEQQHLRNILDLDAGRAGRNGKIQRPDAVEDSGRPGIERRGATQGLREFGYLAVMPAD